MKITRFKHRTVSVPVKYPVVSSVRETSQVMFVLLDVMTDHGVSGISYVQAFNVHGAQAIRSILNLLEEVVKGKDSSDIETIWNQMYTTTKLLGHQGLAHFAISMVDLALWDLAGKGLGLPVYRFLGGSQKSFEAYSSDGCWLSTPQEVAKQAAAVVQSGFSAVKMRFGRKNSEQDVQALKEIRAAVGDHTEIMGDVNQGWTKENTILMAPKLESLGLSWLEEPIDADDMEGHAELMKVINIPVTTGENLYGIKPFQRFLLNNAASVYTPDLQRIGGISGWKRIYPLFESFGSRFSIHLFPEYAVHLFTSVQKPSKLEWMSWAGALFEEPLLCDNGRVEVPDRPGFGMNWDENKVALYEM